MKDFFKSYELYFKTAYNRGLAILGIVVLLIDLAILVLFGLTESYKSEECLNNLNVVLFGLTLFHSFVMMAVANCDKMNHNKIFLSLKKAKHFYTITPVAVIGSMFLFYDILSVAMALIFLDTKWAAELLVAYSVNSVVLGLSIVTNELPKLRIVTWITALFGTLVNVPIIMLSRGNTTGTGFSFEQALLITLGIYIIGGGLMIGIMNIWWHKSGRNLKYKSKLAEILNLNLLWQ